MIRVTQIPRDERGRAFPPSEAPRAHAEASPRIVALRRLALAFCLLAAATAASALEYHCGALYHRWTWEGALDEERASQFLAPLDLSLRPARHTRLAAGADLAWTRVEDGAGAATLSAPRAVRGAVDQGLLHDRLRLGLGVTSALGWSGLDAEEARVARALDEVTLDWPSAEASGGTRVLLDGAVQPIRRPDLLLQFGAGHEWRGEYELISDGRRFEPGGRMRWAGSLVAQLGSSRQDLAVSRESSDRSRLVDGWWYEAGPLTRAEVGSRFTTTVGTIALRAAGLWREGGRVEAGSAYRLAALRGGNALRAGVGWTRRIAGGIGGVEVAGAGVRGFAGDLGHADWVEVGLSWQQPQPLGAMRLAVTARKGSCRGGRDLSGLTAKISVFGATR